MAFSNALTLGREYCETESLDYMSKEVIRFSINKAALNTLEYS